VSTEVDFLIITALKEETDAVCPLLVDAKDTGNEIVGTVAREDSAQPYLVALTEIGGMGSNAAQGVTSKALQRLKPKRVILAGIAAGFRESGVALGDLLLPYFVVLYELAKVKDAVSSRNRLLRFISFLARPFSRRTKSDYRGTPRDVSDSLWHCAHMLGRNPGSPWAARIKTPRQDGTTNAPTVRSSREFVLGCGNKVIASTESEDREWLLSQYGKKAIGLEMESYGVLTACHVGETPFLVVKGVQDDGTGGKDDPEEKDQWRLYAAEASAVFVVALISRYVFGESALLEEHAAEVSEIADIFQRDVPAPPFERIRCRRHIRL